MTDRAERERHGRRAETIAAAYLMLLGHRILARRHRTPFGEIDIIAKRGRRIAFVEVKFRATTADTERALARQQAGRIARAASHWMSKHPGLRDHDQAFDAVLIAPWSRPRLIKDALQPIGTSGPRF